MKIDKRLLKLLRCDDRDVLFRRLANNKHVESISMSDGYYGSVKIVCRDGKQFLELPRDYWSYNDPWVVALQKAFVRLMKYVRN